MTKRGIHRANRGFLARSNRPMSMVSMGCKNKKRGGFFQYALTGAAPGFRRRDSGALSSLGNEGTVWSASTEANGAEGWRLTFLTTSMNPQSAHSCAFGFLLRCLSE